MKKLFLNWKKEPTEFEATSPGHPVFAEYIGAHWCPPCRTTSTNLTAYTTQTAEEDHNPKISHMFSFWESQNTGWPNDAPINRRAHHAPTGYPTTVLGDADKNGADSTYYTSGGQSYDSYYQNGGNTVNGNSYSLSVLQSENGNNMDISITAAYTGSGTQTVFMYAAVTEEVGPEPYSQGSPYSLPSPRLEKMASE